MTDLENDPLAGAFDDLRGQVAPFVRPAGVSRTRETVRTRKRNHTVVVGVLAALVVAIPAGAVAIRHNDAPTPASGHEITVAELNRSLVRLPPWPSDAPKECPDALGKLGAAPPDYVGERAASTAYQVVYVDINHDGKKETIADVECVGFHRITKQIVAFYQDKKGTIHTLGQVTEETGSTAVGICALEGGPDSTVKVQFQRYGGPGQCFFSRTASTYPRFVTVQWRTFGWTGKGFAQQGGPTSVPPNPYLADLSITNSELILVHQANGHYRGSMTVTVRNHGTTPMPFRAETALTSDMHVTASKGFRLSLMSYGAGMVGFRTTGAPIPGGGASTVTLTFDTLRSDDAWGFDPGSDLITGGEYGDTNSSNDQVPLTVKFQG